MWAILLYLGLMLDVPTPREMEVISMVDVVGWAPRCAEESTILAKYGFSVKKKEYNLPWAEKTQKSLATK
jgi:hypothetical protein